MSLPSSASILAIQKAYVAFYGRPADYAGMIYWAGVLDQNGGNLNAVIQSFGNSVESSSLYGSSGTAARIDKIYQQLFNRAADEAGKAYWAGEIDAGRTTLQSAALAIMNGAQNDDLALINRKVVAAQNFTETLRSQNMSHAYGEADIAPARAYLSNVTAGMSDSSLNALLQNSMLEVQNATWTKLITASNVYWYSDLGYYAKWAPFDGGMVFGTSGQINYNVARDVFMAKLDDSLNPSLAVRLGNAAYGETLDGMSKSNAGFLAWGDLHNQSSTALSNLQFVWSLDADLRPLAAAHIGTTNGSAPTINDVKQLANGKILVVGQQNNVADNWDAFAIIFNSDMTVHAQKRFDGPANGSSENFLNSYEFADGSLLLMGSGGELLKVDQSLNIIASRDIDYYYTRNNIQPLENGLFLVYYSNSFMILDQSLAVKSYFTTSDISELVLKSPGYFTAYDSPGRFFDLHIDTSNPASPILEASNYKDLTTRSGSKVYIEKLSASDDVVTAVYNNEIFTFNMAAPASPNLAADYRLSDVATTISWNVRTYTTYMEPGWTAADLQIVAVGSLPDYNLTSGLIQNAGVTAI